MSTNNKDNNEQIKSPPKSPKTVKQNPGGETDDAFRIIVISI